MEKKALTKRRYISTNVHGILPRYNKILNALFITFWTNKEKLLDKEPL